MAGGVDNTPQASPRATSSGTRRSTYTVSYGFPRALREEWQDSRSWQTLLSNIKLLEAEVVQLPDGRKLPFGQVDITEVTYSLVKQIADRWLANGKAPATVKRKLDTLSKMLSLHARRFTDDFGRPILKTKPAMPSIKVRNTVDRVLTREEERDLLKLMDQLIADGDNDMRIFKPLFVLVRP